MAKSIRQPLVWAWALVIVWGVHASYTLFTERWVGLVISLVGLVSALLITSAMQSRRRKNLYPD